MSARRWVKDNETQIQIQIQGRLAPQIKVIKQEHASPREKTGKDLNIKRILGLAVEEEEE